MAHTRFPMAGDLRMDFTFFKWLESKVREESYFLAHENYVRLQFQCPYVSSGWNTAVCVHAPVAAFGLFELSHCSGDRPQSHGYSLSL